MNIAVAGKGGSGKTTIAALIVRALVDAGRKPILAVDADPNANFGSALGIKWDRAVSDVLEEVIRLREPSAGYSKLDMVEYGLHHCLSEGKGVDLLVMGRPEGPDCYCAANHLLREYMDRISGGYYCAVLDNEAGMEHLSRKTTRNVDLLVLVSDASVVGIRAAARIHKLVQELRVSVKKEIFLLNKASGEISEPMLAEARRAGLSMDALLPFDETIARMALDETPVAGVSEESAMLRGVKEMLSGLRVTQRE